MSARKDITLHEQKTLQFKRENRKQELIDLFASTRKQMMKREAEENWHSPLATTQQDIREKVEKLFENSPEYEETLDSLWKDCLSSEKIQFFSRESICRLCAEVKRLRWSAGRESANTIMMLVWIIGNWCYYFTLLPVQLAQTVPDLLALLTKDFTPKLNHLIIYLLTNCCNAELARVELLRGGAVRAITHCSLYENKEIDISTFLCNFFYNLPYSYSIDEDSRDCIIDFLLKTKELSRVDKEIRRDSILIISKLLIVNEGAFHGDVVGRLSSNIRIYFERMNDIMKEGGTEDILEMLTYLYRERKIDTQSELFKEDLYALVWKAVEQELQKGPKELGEKEEDVKKKIWNFLGEFCKIESDTTDDILANLYQQCFTKEIGDYEHQAMKILTKNYHKYSELEFSFWSEELIELHPDEDLCKDLMKIIRKCLDYTINPFYLLQNSQRMVDLLKTFIFHQDGEISKLARSIVYYGQGTPNSQMVEEEEEKQHSKSSKKSVGRENSVLFTPNSMNSNQISIEDLSGLTEEDK